MTVLLKLGKLCAPVACWYLQMLEFLVLAMAQRWL